MPSRKERRCYYFDTDDFIDIVHELEEIPETAPAQDDASSDIVAEADVEQWQKLFGMGVLESRYLIAHVREMDLVPSEEALEAWP
jgi:hypothetical protein